MKVKEKPNNNNSVTSFNRLLHHKSSSISSQEDASGKVIPGGLLKLKTKQIIKSFDSRGGPGSSSNKSTTNHMVGVYGGNAASAVTMGGGSGSG